MAKLSENKCCMTNVQSRMQYTCQFEFVHSFLSLEFSKVNILSIAQCVLIKSNPQVLVLGRASRTGNFSRSTITQIIT
jgi:hypothetical protein